MAETSKKRTVRIPLDYYKRPDRLAWWRRLLSAVAVVLAVLWASGLGWDFWSAARWSERARGLASHGPLTRSHATWEMQCETCHAPSGSTGLASWAAPALGDFRENNKRCEACHVAGIHHARQQPLEDACASCHHDHQGRDASLVKIADQHCTRCHGKLNAHVQGELTSGIPEKIVRFDASRDHHPEFRTTNGTDTGHLKFTHARHLTLGMATKQFGPVQTLKRIGAADQGRYEKYARGTEGYIQLDCAACHQLVRDDPGRVAPSPPSAGDPAYMLPVNYQMHCRGCHPLDFDPADTKLVMEHPLQTADVNDSLWRTYAAEYLKQNPALLDQQIPLRPMPGQTESLPLVEARAAIERKVADAEKILFGAKKCGECHEYEAAGKPVAVLARWNPASPVQVTKTDVPVVWWRSAAFSHSAHRGVDCRGCHAAAYAESRDPEHPNKDVLLPAIEKCVECHSPRSHGANATGGAGFDCTECHRYHNGDAALMGLTPTPAAPSVPLMIEQFLGGDMAAKKSGVPSSADRSEKGRADDRPATRGPG